MTHRRVGALGALILVACLVAGQFDRVAFLAAWLTVWLFCLGIVLGGLANVWVHTLTHGAWGEPIRGPLLGLGRLLPWLALLFLPLLLGSHDLYPWVAEAGQGVGRWGGELSAPGFKSAWLQPGPFVVRAIGLLILWNLLGWMSRRAAWSRSGPFAAAALILYGLSMSVAAVDWIMSLMPIWYSSIFGLEVGLGQVLAGMAFAVLVVARQPAAIAYRVGRDLGNLLLAFVLTWAYAAFAQWLIIWSENLPHEISWYVARRTQPWLALGGVLAGVQFAAPLLLLLFRAIKDHPARLGRVAAALLAAHMVEVVWLVLPSVGERVDGWHLLWLLPLSTLGFLGLCYGLLPEAVTDAGLGEAGHE